MAIGTISTRKNRRINATVKRRNNMAEPMRNMQYGGKTMKGRLPMHANTMKGLQHWYHALFEKVGWIALAKAKGYNYKVTPYKKSIANLKKSIEHLMKEYTDPDRLHDLRVLHMNTMFLNKYVSKCV
jgi:hypothetical protein